MGCRQSPSRCFTSRHWGLVAGVRGQTGWKGIRTAPRDALVADSVTSETRGRPSVFTGRWIPRAMTGLVIAALVVWWRKKIHSADALYLSNYCPGQFAAAFLRCFRW